MMTGGNESERRQKRAGFYKKLDYRRRGESEIVFVIKRKKKKNVIVQWTKTRNERQHERNLNGQMCDDVGGVAVEGRKSWNGS